MQIAFSNAIKKCKILLPPCIRLSVSRMATKTGRLAGDGGRSMHGITIKLLIRRFILPVPLPIEWFLLWTYLCIHLSNDAGQKNVIRRLIQR